MTEARSGADKDAPVTGEGDETQYCFGGTRECSGVNPCPACAGWVNGIVIPFALQAAGLEETVDPQELIDGLAAGYKRLHWLINNDPEVRSQITVMRSRRRAAPPNGQNGGGPGVAKSHPGARKAAPQTPVEVSFTAEEIAEANERKAKSVVDPEVEDALNRVARPRAESPATRPLTEEEIAETEEEI